MRIAPWAAVALAAIALAGCGSRQKEIEAERREFAARARAELDSLDVHAAQTRARFARLGRKVSRETEDRLRLFETRRGEVRRELDELERTGSKTWKRAEAVAETSLAGLDSLWGRVQRMAPER